jgi:hypothetical protein
MYTYTLIANSTSILRSDGAVIPNDPNNTDYANYLKWVAAGNTVNPVPGPTLAQAQATQATVLNNACQAAIYAGFQSSALGAAYTYPAQDTDQLNMNSCTNAANIALTSPAWVAGATVAQGSTITMNGQGFVATQGGVSGTTAPNFTVLVGTAITDGSVIWQIWTTKFWCANAAGDWAFTPHTAAEMRQVGLDGLSSVSSMLEQNSALQLQVLAAITVEAVQSIAWTNPA